MVTVSLLPRPQGCRSLRMGPQNFGDLAHGAEACHRDSQGGYPKWDQSQTVKCSDLSLYPPRAFLTPIRFPSRKCSDVLKKLGGRGLPRVVPLASHRRSGGWVGPGCCREPAWDMCVIPREPWHPDLHPEPLTSSVCVCGPLTKGKLHATPLHSGVWSLEQVGGF